MVKGTIAKSNVIKKIEEAFGSDYVGEVDKKIYVWADDGGERVQIAISLTKPAVPVGTVVTANKDGGINFTSLETTVAPTTFQPAEISEEEVENTRALMERLGLI